MNQPALDKIIGSSLLNKNRFCVHYKTGACAFASHGFFSCVIPSKLQRFDFPLSDEGREISSMNFSITDNVLAIGENGSNSKIYIFSMNEKCDSILQRNEIKTKENGFSCMVLSYSHGKLVTVGIDAEPFLLLWDLSLAKPMCIGYYRLSCIPEHLFLSNDSTYVIVSGNRLLCIVDITIASSQNPVSLSVRKINTERTKNEHFVSSAVYPSSPQTVYVLTENGTLLVFDSSIVANRKGKTLNRTIPPISLTSVSLGCGNTNVFTLDHKIILVGTSQGSILAIKRENEDHSVFGQFSYENKSVCAMGIAERTISAAYEDGSIVIWQRKINSKPILALQSHRGPVCCLSTCNDFMFTGGSDFTLKKWKINRNRALIGKSSQEHIASIELGKKSYNYQTEIKGIRCMGILDPLLFVGDDNGILHVFSTNNMAGIQRIVENSMGVLSIDVCNDEKIIVTGGSDGIIRVYKVSSNSQNTLSRVQMKQIMNAPITSIKIIGQIICAASPEGVVFVTRPNLEQYSIFQTNQPILSISAFPNQKYVLVGGIDQFISILKVTDGTVFRQYKVSSSAYSLHTTVSPSGLFALIALSDSKCILLDTMSGDILEVFNSMAGMITSCQFHEDDILITSLSGCIMRWCLPQSIINAIAEKSTKCQPIIDMLRDEVKEPQKPSGSVLAISSIPNDCYFKEVVSSQIKQEPIVLTPSNEDPENTSDQANGYDAPRPSVTGQTESRIDDIVRASLCISKKQLQETITNKDETRVHEFNQAMEELGSVVSKVKELLVYSPANHDEEIAQSELRTMYDEFQKEGLKADWFPQVMGSYMMQFFEYIKKQ